MGHQSGPHLQRSRTGSQRAIVRRRGVASVLAMMFMVLFGSLAAAMAVVAQGNLRTADSGMKLSRAMSAAETGLVFATRRLAAEGSRFVIEKGVIDVDFGEGLWDGSYIAPAGAVVVLPPDGYSEGTPPTGIVEALRNAHLADAHSITPEPGDSALPEIDAFGTLRVRPIALTAIPDGAGGMVPAANGPYFRLRYEFAMLEDEPFVKVTSQGVDRDVTRTLQMDFRITKKIKYAILSPNRIMIGKNVRVEGPLGSRYGLDPGELDGANSHPLVMRSDFFHLNLALDDVLTTYFGRMVLYDVDGDGRLRPDHPAEGAGLAGYPELVDYDLPPDGYVDDFDLFMAHYDADGDRRLVYDGNLTNEVGLGILTEEFTDDLQLARLIDNFNPDRDGDGEATMSDRYLGYRDGILDAYDTYAKVRGRLLFALPRSNWESAIGDSYQTVVAGPIQPGPDDAPVVFDATDEELRELTTEMFADSQTWFEAQVPGVAAGLGNFNGQVSSQDNNGAPNPDDTAPDYIAPSDDTWEAVPFGSQGAYDYFQRPVYENMEFTNLRIPAGNNGLFVNCTFIGVTFISTEEDCDHYNWNYAGSLEPVTDPDTGDVTYELRFPGLESESGGVPVADTRDVSNNVRFDNCTFLGSIAGDKPNEYAHWRNKVQMTGNTRFYVDRDDPDLLVQPDVAEIQAILDGMVPADLAELAKSSILMPGWSLDVGNFANDWDPLNPQNTAKVKLKGTIIAGILDVRGTADVHGTLLMTFRPVEGVGPLNYGGLPDAFNTTIGYFGPSDGDGEGVDPDDAAFTGFGEITLRYDPDAKLPDGIPWPITVESDPTTYTEGSSL